MAESRFPVGILFVHGIGEQRRGETLVSWGEPLAIWVDRWLQGTSRRWLAAGATAADVAAWRDQAIPEWDRTLAPEEALRCRLVAERVHRMALRQPAVNPGPPIHRGGSSIVAGQAKLYDAVLERDDTRPELPPHTALRLLTLRADGKVAQSAWLMAESHWAQAFTSPSFLALGLWAILVVPGTVASHFGTGVRRAWTRKRAGPLAGLARLANVGFRGALFVGGLLFGLMIAVMILALAPLAYAPLGPIRQGARSLQRVLASTIGDSYILCASPLQAAAIVGRMRRDLAWLGERCEKVLVVAHSQGGAVAFEAVRGDGPARVDTLITFGSGLRKLEELRSAMEEDRLAHFGGFLSMLGLVLALEPFALGATPLVCTLGGVLGVALMCAGLLRSAGFTDLPTVRIAGQAFRSRKLEWQDYYADSDPVPNGALFDDEEDGAEAVSSSELHNRGSIFSDHNAYWQNREQFVSRIANAASALTNLKLDTLAKEDPPFLWTARLRRLWRVGMLRAGRWGIGVTGVTLLALGRPLELALGKATARALASLAGFFPFAEPVKRWLTANTLLLGILALLLILSLLYRWLFMGTWLAWDRREGDSLVRRESFGGSAARRAGFIIATVILSEAHLVALLLQSERVRSLLERHLWVGIGLGVLPVLVGFALSGAWWRYAQRREKRTPLKPSPPPGASGASVAGGASRESVVAGVVLMAMACAAPARAALHPGYPNPSRLFTTQSILRLPSEIEARAKVRTWVLEVAGLRFSEGDTPGGPGAHASRGFAGGRLGLEFDHGLWQIGAEGIEDSGRDIERAEYPVQLHGAWLFPRARLTTRAVAGFDQEGYAGIDGVAEIAGPALPVHLPTVDLRPRVHGWLRVRSPQDAGATVLSPAVSVSIPHVPLLGSGLPLAVTAQSDLAGDALPESRLIAQLGWIGPGWGLGSPPLDARIRRGRRRAPRRTVTPFAGIAYDRPLDRRAHARFTLAAGATFNVPLESR